VNGEIVSESGEAHEDKSCAMGAARRIRPADADIQVEEWLRLRATPSAEREAPRQSVLHRTNDSAMPSPP
jgi:hypothetical protein